LRERGEDIVHLARHYLQKTCSNFGREPMQLTRSQADMLLSYSWPGNVRELKNVIERAVILSPRNVLRLDLSMATAGSEFRAAEPVSRDEGRILTETELRELQKNNLLAALKQTAWKVSGPGGAAEMLGVKATTLADRIRTFGLQKPR
jgi:transcriptional regulator with GAF, ATPase, and Fis domain